MGQKEEDRLEDWSPPFLNRLNCLVVLIWLRKVGSGSSDGRARARAAVHSTPLVKTVVDPNFL